MKDWIYSVGILVAVLIAGSMLSSMIINNSHSGHHSVFDRIQHEGYHPDSVNVSSITHMANVDTVSVKAGDHSFAILERESQIQSFACSECHNEDLASLMNKRKDVGEKSHWNIELKHASGEIMACVTCHSSDNMDQLHTLTDQKISFNESYKLCAQCHQTQFKDWSGGAHGKRVGGWAKPVIRNTCVNCHDPHSPSFPHKYPSRINTRMMQQRAKK